MSIGTNGILGGGISANPFGDTNQVTFLGGSTITDNGSGSLTISTPASQTLTFSQSGTSGAVIIPMSNVMGLEIFNTADQVTNFEMVSLQWSSNVFMVTNSKGGTGSLRAMTFGRGANQGFIVGSGAAGSQAIDIVGTGGGANGIIQYAATSTGTAGVAGHGLTFTSTSTASSTNFGVVINPTWNQASGGASNTDLLVNRTQTAVGSGTQRLIDLQVSTVSKFSVDNTGNAQASGSILSNSQNGVGYVVGAGGVTTQLTSKATSVTLNKIAGQITMNNSALASATTVTFTVTNSSVGVADLVIVNLVSGNATPGTYEVWPEAIASGSFKVNTRNISAGSLSEALVLNYGVFKGATS